MMLAMDSRILAYGTATLSCRALAAFLILVKKSAIESLNDIFYLSFSSYQLDFVTPGSWPASALFLKQILHMSKRLIYALGLPHIGHLLYVRTGNFCFLFAFIMIEVFAIP
jgi:hypothetical protein